MRYIQTLFLLFLATVLLGQNDDSFSARIDECYKNPEFKDIVFRLINERACYIGLDFPSFSINDINGNLISNSAFQDKIVVLNFWFTTCPPCLEEIPHFNSMVKNYKDHDVLFYAPSIDDEKTLKKFLSQYGEMSSTLIPNSTRFFRETLASKSGFPTTIVLDKNGMIVEYFSGGLKDFAVLEKLIDELLVN